MNKQEFSIQLGQNIRRVRQEIGISQSELAKRCLKDKQHIQLIESGKINVTSYNLFLIVKALETDFNSILSMDNC